MKKLFPPIISALLLLCSCNVAYIPSMHQVPLLQKKGDVQINVTPANFQAAAAITDIIGLMCNGQISGSSWTNNDNGYNSYSAKRRFFEVGAGYFKKQEENKTFEIYGGATYGSIDFRNSYAYPGQKFSANATKVFIQPAFGIVTDYVEVAIAVKCLKLSFFNVSTTNYGQVDLENDKLYNLDKNPFLFVEPSITLRVGYKFLKAQFQLLRSYKLNNDDINYQPGNFFIGLSARF